MSSSYPHETLPEEWMPLLARCWDEDALALSGSPTFRLPTRNSPQATCSRECVYGRKQMLFCPLEGYWRRKASAISAPALVHAPLGRVLQMASSGSGLMMGVVPLTVGAEDISEPQNPALAPFLSEPRCQTMDCLGEKARQTCVLLAPSSQG